MSRARTVPDEVVFQIVLALYRAGGPKAVTFGAVAERAGLAASSLAQRHGTIDGLMRDATAAHWNKVDAATQDAVAKAPISSKGAVAMLKALGDVAVPGAEPVALHDRAAAWRATVESELALRLGGGARAQTVAALLFAAWQGQLAWQPAGGRGFRLKEALRIIGG